jgi:hypothetical protein
MSLSPSLSLEIAEFLRYSPLPGFVALPEYVDYHIAHYVTPEGPDYFAMQRSPRSVSAALIVEQSDSWRLQQ